MLPCHILNSTEAAMYHTKTAPHWKSLALCFVLVSASSICDAAEEPNKELPEPVKQTLATRVIPGFENHSAVQIMYFQAKTAESPVLLLLHDVEGSLQRWARTDIPQRLQAFGFSVITVEMRVFRTRRAHRIATKVCMRGRY